MVTSAYSLDTEEDLMHHVCSGHANFVDVAFEYTIEGLVDCWTTYLANKLQSCGLHSFETASNNQRADFLVEWLRDYNSLSALESNLVKKIESRGGVQSLTPALRHKLRTWLDALIQEDRATESTLIGLLALLRPLHQQLVAVYECT